MWKRIAGTVAVLFCLTVCAEATFRELPVMDWEQRSDWLNVRDYGAKGNLLPEGQSPFARGAGVNRSL